MGSATLSRLLRSGLALCLALAAAARPAVALAAEVVMVAPSPPGSGWDQFAQAARLALAGQPGGATVSVVNVPGGTGTVGLAQFVESAADDDLLVTGLPMLEASVVNRMPIQFDRLAPIARLSAEPFGVAVPAGSPIATVGDLVAAMRGDAGKVSWAGGPGRGLDHTATILFARALALDPTRVNYVSFLTGAEAAQALAEDKVTAAILVATDLEAEVKAGRVRILALTASFPTRIAEAASLVELGIPLELYNWRGFAAKAGISREARARLEAMVATVAASPTWKEFLARKGWAEAYLAGDRFERFVKDEGQRFYAAVKAAGLVKRPD